MTMKNCEICNANDWTRIYHGDVRDGTFGNLVHNAGVFQCQNCSAVRLEEARCIPDSHYETAAYREKLAQEMTGDAFYASHDSLQRTVLLQILELDLRDKIVADVGCGPGGFTDHVAGLAKQIWAIEPFTEYQRVLRDKGFETFSYAADVPAEMLGTADVAVSLQVIEHVRDPRRFLEQIRHLLKPGGIVVVTTPNRKDILMDLLPDSYPAFFYRVVHRWYFDEMSFADCARRAGLDVLSMRTIHRYGLANALHWLRDRRPRGETPLPPLDESINTIWRQFAAEKGQGDTLFAVFRVPG